jgi:hypothetical protein
MSYASGPAPVPHDTPTTRMGSSTGTGPVIQGKTSNKPPTAWKPIKKKRMVGG